MIHWSYQFEKHFSYSCCILHSPQSKGSGKCCTHGESQHTTVHNSGLNAPRILRLNTFNLLFSKFIGLLLFLLNFIVSHEIMIPWKTLVSVILAFTYYTWTYFKRKRNTHMRKNIECEIRKPQYYVNNLNGKRIWKRMNTCICIKKKDGWLFLLLSFHINM